nr:serine/arginine-rich splicing factor 4-like [Rhipicephalus microplus]
MPQQQQPSIVRTSHSPSQERSYPPLNQPQKHQQTDHSGPCIHGRSRSRSRSRPWSRPWSKSSSNSRSKSRSKSRSWYYSASYLNSSSSPLSSSRGSSQGLSQSSSVPSPKKLAWVSQHHSKHHRRRRRIHRCPMDTRFAHLNPVRRAQAMSRELKDESDVGNPGEGSARESQKDDRFGNLTPERRLQELRLEMERLSQMMGGSSRWSGPEFDCLLSEEAWKLLHEESTLEGVVKGTSEVGGARPEFESEPQHAEAVWR